MRMHRIITAVVLIATCITSELNAQFSFLFAEKEQVVIHENVQPNNSCTLRNCPPKWTSWGHYPVSWRRWPEDISQYTTNPQLSPFVIPDRSGAPDVQVPSALDETLFSPRNRDTAETTTEANEEAPDTTTNENATVDLPSVDPTVDVDPTADLDPAADLLPEIPDTDPTTESPLDSIPDTSLPESGDGFFEDLEPEGTAPESDGGIDDLLNGGDDFDGFGSRPPRRYQRRARGTDSDRFSEYSSPRKPARIDGLSSVNDHEPEESNPLRRMQRSNEPESVAYALHHGHPPAQRYEDGHRYVNDERHFVDPRQSYYEARQIDYHEYQRRRNLYKYGPNWDDQQRPYPTTTEPQRRSRYDDERYRQSEQLGRPFEIPADRIEKPASTSNNPLRRN